MSVDVRLIGFDQFRQRLQQVPAATARELRQTMTSSLLLIEADAKSTIAQDTRRAAGSIHHVLTGSGLQLQGSVGPSVRYASVIEFGRKAGAKMPPVDALIPWVRRHRLAGTYSVRTRRRLGNRTTQAAQDYRVALAIARKIARRGIPPRPFLLPAYRRNLPAIRQLFAAVGTRVVATMRSVS